MAFALLFNNFFWFPEVLLLFWIFRAADGDARRSGKAAAPGGVALLLLCPRTAPLSRRCIPATGRGSTPYDYGFSYPEKETTTASSAGAVKSRDTSILTQAERRLPPVLRRPAIAVAGQKQIVDIYWRGSFLKRGFQRKWQYLLQIKDRA